MKTNSPNTSTIIARLVISLVRDTTEEFQNTIDLYYDEIHDLRVSVYTEDYFIRQLFDTCIETQMDVNKASRCMNYASFRFYNTVDLSAFFEKCFAYEKFDKENKDNTVDSRVKYLTEIIEYKGAPDVFKKRYYTSLVDYLLADKKNITKNLDKILLYCNIIETTFLGWLIMEKHVCFVLTEAESNYYAYITYELGGYEVLLKTVTDPIKKEEYQNNYNDLRDEQCVLIDIFFEKYVDDRIFENFPYYAYNLQFDLNSRMVSVDFELRQQRERSCGK